MMKLSAILRIAKIVPTTYTLDQVLAGFAGKPEEVNGKTAASFYEDQDNFNRYLRAENSPYVERYEYVSMGILVRKDYF